MGYSITDKTADAEIVRLPLTDRRLDQAQRARTVVAQRNTGAAAAASALDHGKTLAERRSDLNTVVYFDTLTNKYKKFRQTLEG